MHGDDQDFDLGMIFLELAHGGQSVHPGHGQVKEDEIRFKIPCHLNGFQAILRLCHDVKLRLGGDQGFQALPDQGMVFSDQYTNGSLWHGPNPYIL